MANNLAGSQDDPFTRAKPAGFHIRAEPPIVEGTVPRSMFCIRAFPFVWIYGDGVTLPRRFGARELAQDPWGGPHYCGGLEEVSAGDQVRKASNRDRLTGCFLMLG